MSCSECGVVSNVVSSEVQKVQIACIGCKGVLQFPIETQIGTCPICSAVFQIQTNNLTSPRENGGDTPTEPPKRPTTASTRTASKIDSAHENSKPEAGEFLSSATINDGVVCNRLLGIGKKKKKNEKKLFSQSG